MPTVVGLVTEREMPFLRNILLWLFGNQCENFEKGIILPFQLTSTPLLALVYMCEFYKITTIYGQCTSSPWCDMHSSWKLCKYCENTPHNLRNICWFIVLNIIWYNHKYHTLTLASFSQAEFADNNSLIWFSSQLRIVLKNDIYILWEIVDSNLIYHAIVAVSGLLSYVNATFNKRICLSNKRRSLNLFLEYIVDA